MADENKFRDNMADENKFADEVMSDEGLDKVAGGDCYQTADDSRFLNVLLAGTNYHQCDRYGATKIWCSSSGDEEDDVTKAWESLGITAYINGDGCNTNKYVLKCREISQKEAWEYAEKTVGKHLTEEQWNW